ncbi:MAG: hypothetical protein OEV55_09795 [candidate division Zixibacteria bacterium]|nr:hypothetical protein [candidate division Zixibacteria bacterium]
MNRLKKISVFLAPILILIFSIIIATEKKVEQQQQTYVPQVIINAPWGNKPGEFGLYVEGPIMGPSTFTIAPNGDIYIVDTFNNRIQRFSKDGTFLSMMRAHGSGWVEDICVDVNGNTYLIHLGPARIRKIDTEGNLLKVINTFNSYENRDDEDVKGMNTHGGSTRLYCDNSSRLFITYKKENERAQVIFQLGTSEAEFSPEQQKTTIRRGYAGISGKILNKDQIFQYLDGKMFTVDNSDKKITGYNFLSAYSFLDVDGSGNAYMTHYNMDTDIYSVKKQTPDGEEISTFGWKLEGYAQHNLNKPLTVDEDGNVYVLGSTKDGITLTKWSPAVK